MVEASNYMTNIPGNWSVAELGQIGEWCGGGTPSKRNPGYWANGTIPWISPKDMKVFEIAKCEDYITNEAVSASATKIIPKESVVMVTRSGILRHTFPVAVNIVEAALNQDLKALAPYEGMSAKYIAYYLTYCNDKILAACSKDGTTVQSIETDRLKKFKVPLAPRDEQYKIVSKMEELFSDLDKGEDYLRQAIFLLCGSKVGAFDSFFKNSGRLRQSIFKSAFSGTLVPHDLNDEPASELLKRIAVKKTTPASTSRARRSSLQHKKGETTSPAPAKQADLQTATHQKKTASGLAQLRKAAGMSQAELAMAIGLNQAYVSQMENGKRAITRDQAAQIASHLGVSLELLFGEAG